LGFGGAGLGELFVPPEGFRGNDKVWMRIVKPGSVTTALDLFAWREFSIASAMAHV